MPGGGREGEKGKRLSRSRNPGAVSIPAPSVTAASHTAPHHVPPPPPPALVVGINGHFRVEETHSREGTCLRVAE